MKPLLAIAAAVAVSVLLGQERFDPNAVKPPTIAEFCAGFLTEAIVARHQFLLTEAGRMARNPGSTDGSSRDFAWDEIIKMEQSWQRLDCKGILYPNGAPQK